MRAPEFWHSSKGPFAGLAAGLLTPIGAAWGTASRLRRALAEPYRAPVPIICVGNLVVGGAGKTPVALSLAGLLAARGIAVHVVCRGYGGDLAGPVQVDLARHAAEDVGDEPLLLAEPAPCWVARDRAAGIAAAAAAGAAAVLLDDGFQNPTVAKDLSLLVIDAEYGFGNGRVMPAGPLREPVAHGIERASGVVLLGDGPAPVAIGRFAGPVLRAWLDPVAAEQLRGRRLLAFAGIGRPDKFFATLRRAGVELVECRAFPDHHPYTEKDIAPLTAAAVRHGAGLITTTKDWVRLLPEARDRIAVLRVELRWEDPPALAALLDPLFPSQTHAGEHRAARA